jgi:hypothetical protein
LYGDAALPANEWWKPELKEFLMKNMSVRLLLLVAALVSLQGCIAFPPLIQVEHKESPNKAANDEILRRLDAIDRRLDKLEQQKEESK